MLVINGLQRSRCTPQIILLKCYISKRCIVAGYIVKMLHIQIQLYIAERRDIALKHYVHRMFHVTGISYSSEMVADKTIL